MRNRKDDPVQPRGNSSGVKSKMMELDRKIGHNSVMSICEFFIDRDDLAHLVDQFIRDMEVIVYTSAEGSNGMGHFFVADFLLMDMLRFECQFICIFFVDRNVEPPCHISDR